MLRKNLKGGKKLKPKKIKHCGGFDSKKPGEGFFKILGPRQGRGENKNLEEKSLQWTGT